MPESTMSLLTLAPELLLLVAENLKPRDLKSFLRTNKRLSLLLTPVIRKLSLSEKYATVALFFAAANGNEKMVRLLLEKGKNIRVIKDGEVAFTAPDNCSDEMVRFVLEQGVNLVLEDREDMASPFMLLADFWTEHETRRTVSLETAPENRTALHWAIDHTHNTLLETLLANGADIESRNGNRRTALSEATHRSNGTAAKLLIAKGAVINTTDSCRATPLHHAAYAGMGETVKLLLENGADPSACDRWNATALQLAQVRLIDDTLLREMTGARILANEAEFKIFYAAVKKGDVAAATESLSRGCDANKDFIYGAGRVEAAIVVAAGQGNVEMVKLLLDNGADPNGRR